MDAINTSATARTSRLTVEGVGARVVRGPDWKWGKQVLDKPNWLGKYSPISSYQINQYKHSCNGFMYISGWRRRTCWNC